MRFRTFWVLLLASLAPASGQNAGAPSQGPPASMGQTITRIDFSPADQPLPREELDRLLPMHPGDTVTAGGVREAIEKLYLTGRFADVAVEAEPAAGGVILIFNTEPTYFISRVSIRGENEPPNRNQLTTASQLDLGMPFREDAVEAAMARMQERLKANGLFQTTIRYHVDLVDSTEEASIYFDLDAGTRAKFDDIQMMGEFVQSKDSLVKKTGWRRGLRYVPLPGWKQVTDNRIQSGLENLRRALQKDDRLQARVTLDDLGYDAATNRITPQLTISSGPVIEVRATGGKVSQGRLRQLIPVFQERTVDRGLLLEGEANLIDYFRSQGYFDTTVKHVQTQPAPDRTLIEYQIERGEQHKLRGISIAGNTYFDNATLRERMYIQPATLLRFRSGRYSPRLLEQDLETIRALYRSNGFRKVEVTSKVVENPLRHTDITVNIQIVEGPQWIVGSLELAGGSREDLRYLRSILRSTEGQPFSEANIAADRDTILAYFYNNGYPDAGFNWTQSDGADEGTVDVAYSLQTGAQQYIRGVLVRGLETTDPALVLDRIRLRDGDALSQSQIGESQQRLYDLGIFARVQTAVQNPEGEEESKYVLFYADEARKYSFNFGIGAQLARIGGGGNTLNSPAGSTTFAPRVSLGLSRINFMGLGHTISLQTLASTQQRRALLNYLAPQFKGHEGLALSVSALFNDSRDVRTFAARRWEGSVQLSRRFSKANTGQFRFTFRRVTLDESTLNISRELVPLLSQPVRVGLVGGTFFRDRRDDPVDSKRGTYNSVDLALASKAFGSQTSFSRMVLRNSTYHPFRRELVLARSVQFGYIQRLGGLAQIPLAERFFAGGASSQRAFPDNQAGPRDLRSGFPVGGTALFFHSTELRFPLIGDNLGGVLFHDMGNVYSDISNLSFRVRQRNLQDFDYMVHGAGMGVRYRTPVGPIRIDLSYGANSPRFFGFNGTLTELLAIPPGTPLCQEASAQCTNQRISRFQFHFSLGQTF
ncbi:MAG: outer membrane protein assembly factor BamA [Acidobacteriota bacterium]